MSAMRALAHLEPGASIADANVSSVATADVRYVWVDDQDRVVRRSSTQFAHALTWGMSWSGRHDSLVRRLADISEDDWRRERLEAELRAHAPTGRPPVRLLRVVVSARVHELNEAESIAVQGLMEG